MIKIFKGFLILFAIMFIFALFSSPDKEENKISKSGCDQQMMPTLMMENSVKARLKSPATADFPFWDKKEPRQYKINGDSNCHYIVTGYVDSQNGFGAMIRSNYQGTITFFPCIGLGPFHVYMCN